MADDGECSIVACLAEMVCRHHGWQKHGGIYGNGIVVGRIEGIHHCQVQRNEIATGVCHTSCQSDGKHVGGSRQPCRQSGICCLQPVESLHHRLAVVEGGKTLLIPCIGEGHVQIKVVQLVNGIVLGGLAHPIYPLDTLAQGRLYLLRDVEEFVLHTLWYVLLLQVIRHGIVQLQSGFAQKRLYRCLVIIWLRLVVFRQSCLVSIRQIFIPAVLHHLIQFVYRIFFPEHRPSQNLGFRHLQHRRVYSHALCQQLQYRLAAPRCSGLCQAMALLSLQLLYKLLTRS